MKSCIKCDAPAEFHLVHIAEDRPVSTGGIYGGYSWCAEHHPGKPRTTKEGERRD